MSLDAFPSTALAALPELPPGPAASRLAFRVAHQEMDNWCWAAVAWSISVFFDATSTWSQCAVAGSELQLPCCGAGAPAECDAHGVLDQALSRTGNLLNYFEGQMDPSDILDALRASTPVGVRIEWTSGPNSGQGHFLCICGIDASGDDPNLATSDPVYGDSVVPLSVLRGGYQHNGRWTHSYTTTA